MDEVCAVGVKGRVLDFQVRVRLRGGFLAQIIAHGVIVNEMNISVNISGKCYTICSLRCIRELSHLTLFSFRRQSWNCCIANPKRFSSSWAMKVRAAASITHRKKTRDSRDECRLAAIACGRKWWQGLPAAWGDSTLRHCPRIMTFG